MKRKYRIGSVSLSHEIVASPSRICSSVSLVATPRPPQGADRFMLTTILAYVIAPRNDPGKEIMAGLLRRPGSGPVRIRNDLDASHFSDFEAQEVG